ncbi:MAG TPA: hypothetical protein VN381_14730 [Anaerovoracaceae bacterium]|nr:hypothetical protein [Anaerovoracaceae bacterium]
MRALLELLAGMVNYLHDLVLAVSKALGLGLSDKDLHFWMVGALGLVVFIVSDWAIRLLARWSLSAISFIYTLTILTVFVFAVEIEQAITGKGSMEFEDITMGLYGFLVFIAIYLLLKMAVHMLQQKK